jgi:hypothetical protein
MPYTKVVFTCRGRVYIQVNVPSKGPPAAPGAIITQPTGDVRGNGAFATLIIPRGTHIADYSGQLLDRQGFFAKYPDGVVRFRVGSMHEAPTHE